MTEKVPEPASSDSPETGGNQPAIISIDSPLKNIPSGISEASIIAGCRRVEIRSRLRPYALAVRDGRMVRVVVAGMPFYSEVRR